MKEYDLIVFIGRFQPFHNAQLEIAKRAFEYANDLLFIVGSADKPSTYKNPFTSAGSLISLDIDDNIDFHVK
jgi:bifunctional NMN adenylyltransferase/nudix hydrolase